MDCPSCGRPGRSGAAFCVNCGAALEAPPSCPSCGTPSQPGGRFCEACGTALTPSAKTDRLRAPAAERRLVTVLFADAEGSTALTERIGDEEAYRLMQGCVTRMVEAVERHGGTITQFRGDGVMALFGAPVAHEDSAVRAVTAALEMQIALEALRSDVAQRLGAACQFRIGLNTGPVVVGRVGDDVLMDYTAIGDTANVAARVEQAAEPGAVFLAEATWRAVRDFAECEPVGELDVKGKSRPVAAYKALRRTAARSRLDAALARGLTRFVGREHELALLQSCATRLSSGQGRVVLVTGEPGIGKSRLLLELKHRLSADASWFEGSCSMVGRNVTWLPIADLLRRALGVEESDEPQVVSARVDDRSSGWSDAAKEAVPYLKWLLNAGGDELEGLDPRERRAGAYEALRATMLDAAGRRPLVVVIEDLHWADEASEGAVAALADAVAEAPVLLILTYRPGYPMRLDERPWHTRVALDQLPVDESGLLAAGVLEVADLPDEIRQLIASRAEGNPLFVEEVTASLVETGAIRRAADTFELAVEPSRIDVPNTLQDVILARIDRLERDAREALQLAAVIGREFTRRLLDRIADLPGGLDEHLGALQSLELIRQKSFFPELAFLFKHALTHDVAYSTLLDERRRTLHGVVARAIEELYADRLIEHYETLARHWLEAGDDRRALDYLERSGNKAMDSFAIENALEHFGRAIELCERLGDADRMMSLLDRQATVHMSMVDLDAAMATADRMLAVARGAGDGDMQAVALAIRGNAELWAHDFEAAESSLREAIAIGPESAPNGFVFAGATLRGTCMVLDRFDEVARIDVEVGPLVAGASERARSEWIGMSGLWHNWRADWERVESVLAEGHEPTDLETRLLTLWTKGTAAAGKGDYERALGALGEVVSAGERGGEVLCRARALNTIGWIFFDLGDLAAAAVWNRRCLDFIGPIEFPDAEIEANARLNLADVFLAQGRFDDAEAELDWVGRIVRDPKPPEQWMLWRYSQHFFHTSGELALARGDAEGALGFAVECVELAQRSESRKHIVKGRRLLGQALVALGRVDDANGELDAAVTLAREVGNPPQLWRTLFALAALHAAAGDADAARRCEKDAREVIDAVADSLSDPALRASLRGAYRASATS